MNRSYEDLKVDIGLLPQSLISTNATGKYYSMKEYREALAILTAGNITAAGTTALQIMEAKTERAGSAQALTSRVATIAANVKVASLSITCAGGVAEDTLVITVGGVAYTFIGKAATDTAEQEFKADGDDDSDAAAIVECVNVTLAGKVFASAAAAVVTLVAEDGYYIESISETGSFTTFATVSAQAYVWLDSMDLTDTYGWIACKVTTASNTGICNAVLVRGKSKGAIVQRMGDQYPA